MGKYCENVKSVERTQDKKLLKKKKMEYKKEMQ